MADFKVFRAWLTRVLFFVVTIFYQLTYFKIVQGNYHVLKIC